MQHVQLVLMNYYYYLAICLIGIAAFYVTCVAVHRGVEVTMSFFRTWIWTRAQKEWKRRSLRLRRRKLLAHAPEHAQGHALGLSP